MPGDFFFTFLDRSLAYDCARCGQLCCKRSGLVLDAGRDLIQFARLEPRLAAHARPLGGGRWDLVEAADGCSMLEPSGFCAIETAHGREAKPLTCRLFPFNAITRIGSTRVVDFHNRICPLDDVADARTGQDHASLAAEIEAEGKAPLVQTQSQLPPDAAPLGWRAFEERARDAIAAHLHDGDALPFAAWQEEAAVALLQKRPLPEPHDAAVQARAASLRPLLESWRELLGVAADPGLLMAARTAARQLALLTSSLRMNLLQRRGVAPYAVELQRMPRHLLATAHLVELGLLARKRPPGLRTAVETFQGAAPLAALLSLWDRPARLRGELPAEGVPLELKPALAAAGKALRRGGRPLGEALREGLIDLSPHLRALALSQLAYGGAPLEIS